jgi:hypothetical protein
MSFSVDCLSAVWCMRSGARRYMPPGRVHRETLRLSAVWKRRVTVYHPSRWKSIWMAVCWPVEAASLRRRSKVRVSRPSVARKQKTMASHRSNRPITSMGASCPWVEVCRLIWKLEKVRRDGILPRQRLRLRSCRSRLAFTRRGQDIRTCLIILRGRDLGDSGSCHPCHVLIEIGKAFCDITAGEFTHPAIRRRKEANAREIRVLAHIEPVRGVGGYADQIAFFAQDDVDLVIHV